MKLNVISFNIRCCDDKDGNTIAERAPRLFKIVNPYKADIIGLQEYRPAWENYIEENFANEYDMFVKYRNKTVDIEASPILWRKDKFECVKTGYFWFSDTPEVESRGWDIKYNCYRMCVCVMLKEIESGKCFTVMNTHFGFGDKGQVGSAKLIYDYAQNFSNAPTFVVGDFNMHIDHLGYMEMTKNFVDVNAVTVNDMGTTYHNYRPQEVTEEHIDYCFVSKNIIPINQTIIRDSVDGKYPSDHFGLYIELDV